MQQATNLEMKNSIFVRYINKINVVTTLIISFKYYIIHIQI